MPRGVPLTPEQLADIASRFALTGNASEVARQLGLEVSTVTRALGRIPEQERATLHRLAINRGLRNGRARLAKAQRKLAKVLFKEIDAGSAEPQHLAQLTGAFVSTVRELTRMSVLDLRAQQARLTRELTRAEIRKVTGKDKPKTAFAVPTYLAEPRTDAPTPTPTPAPATPDPDAG